MGGAARPRCGAAPSGLPGPLPPRLPARGPGASPERGGACGDGAPCPPRPPRPGTQSQPASAPSAFAFPHLRPYAAPRLVFTQPLSKSCPRPRVAALPSGAAAAPLRNSACNVGGNIMPGLPCVSPLLYGFPVTIGWGFFSFCGTGRTVSSVNRTEFFSPGVNRHFHMICIRDKFSQNIGRQISSKVIWDHLSTMYDMQALVSITD